MKSIFPILVLLLSVAILSPPPLAEAQIPLSTNSVQIYNYQTLANAKTYAANQVDTLPSPWPVASAFVPGAAANFIEIEQVFQDSVNEITQVQYRADANATWTTVQRDTLNQTGGGAVTTATKREIVVRSQTVDKLSGLTGHIRVITTFGATVNGFTTPTYRARFIWKP